MIKRIRSLTLICIALILALCSCAQSLVNSDRLTGSEKSENSNLSNSEEVVDENDTILGKYVDADRVFKQDDFFGYGHVNFYVNDIKLADNMSDAGIDEAIYQLSGSPSYDYYITVSLTIENVDVPVDDGTIDDEFVKSPLINSFRLHRQAKNDNDSRDYELAYFNRGGVASSDTKRYFQYQLPNIGETLDAVIGFGLWDHELSDIKSNNDSLYLRNTYMPGMMPIEVTL